MISNRQLQKVTKSKSVFPTDDSLLKMLYLAMMDITKKWTGRRQDWSMIHAQMAAYFADRMPEYRRPCRRSRACAPPERRRFDERRTSAALDIRPPPALCCRQGGNGLRCCRPKNFCSVFHHSTLFTQNLGLTPYQKELTFKRPDGFQMEARRRQPGSLPAACVP